MNTCSKEENNKKRRQYFEQFIDYFYAGSKKAKKNKLKTHHAAILQTQSDDRKLLKLELHCRSHRADENNSSKKSFKIKGTPENPLTRTRDLLKARSRSYFFIASAVGK